MHKLEFEKTVGKIYRDWRVLNRNVVSRLNESDRMERFYWFMDENHPDITREKTTLDSPRHAIKSVCRTVDKSLPGK